MQFGTGLSRAQVEAVVIHELAHIQRRDSWTYAWQILIETLLFYHPLVRTISNQLRIERENCCDDWAIAQGCQPLELAVAIQQMEKRKREFALAFANSGNSAARINRLLKGGTMNKHWRLGWNPGMVLAVLLFVRRTAANSSCESWIASPPAVRACGSKRGLGRNGRADGVVFGRIQQGWSARYMRQFVQRQGGSFVALPSPGEEAKRDQNQFGAGEEAIRKATVIVVNDFDWSQAESMEFAQQVAEQVRQGKSNLVYSATEPLPSGHPLQELITKSASAPIRELKLAMSGRLAMGEQRSQMDFYGPMLQVRTKPESGCQTHWPHGIGKSILAGGADIQE